MVWETLAERRQAASALCQQQPQRWTEESRQTTGPGCLRRG
jgi:hypothetical protein